MGGITFITGGQRSGKSSFAQKLAQEKSERPIYLATARIWDEDFKKRIDRHKSDRGDNWVTIEENKYISKQCINNKTVLLDCVTLWLNNFFFDNNYDVEKALEEAKAEWDAFITKDIELIVVSNELGMGVHAENDVSRKFADLQGWMNQYIASKADRVFLMVSGIPLEIK
ncbi:MAG: bifunctional adenosylcobinamide kinase/adenosylcobinamide-phosphate guanylyltransferase [Bacteroidales bacterium]|nr:bifunctional adenosylcobinamide kinase/adenosylcobinamide-phosphate guanylyltransferase [Bacteroidales bacterium]